MREIKFRAWDKEYKQFQESFLLPIHDCNSALEPRCVLQQYTGLKDKNDVEIYEGDIVQIFPRYNGICKVIFNKGSFGVEGKLYASNRLDLSFGVEVIGNIYENPELLNTKEKE